ncbi:MAG: GIY-YIG nuclease family protein [Chloroflexi bacterium]|nr:GIY-YIG nuclease family protein [Chloroflexota bacterium]
MFAVYILQSQRIGRYYIGRTKDVAQRLQQHNLGMTKSTRNFRPWRLVHCENFDTRAEASKREALLKSWKNPKYLEQALGLSPQSTLRVSRCSSGR